MSDYPNLETTVRVKNLGHLKYRNQRGRVTALYPDMSCVELRMSNGKDILVFLDEIE